MSTGSSRASGGGASRGRPAGAAKPSAKYTPAETADEPSTGSDAGVGGAAKKGSKQIDEVNAKLADVRTVMTDNMRKTVERGQQLEDIEHKSEVLLVDANKFQESASATKRMFCRRNARNIAIISIIGIVFLALVIYFASQ